MVDVAGSRWVITGAAGTIGTALRTALAEMQVELVSTDIRPVSPVAPQDVVATADLSDLNSLVELFENADGVIHLGGIPDEADFHDLAEVNIVGTYHVLEAARRAGVPRVVYASSNRLTGMYSAGDPVSSDMPPRPDGFYGVSKVAGEALCRLYADKFGISTIAVRIGSYEHRPGSAREQRTWLSPSDAVRAFLATMTTAEHVAVFYAVSANTGRWWDLKAGDAVGFIPEDDAARWGAAEDYDPNLPQGGIYASKEYSIGKMSL
ncbi:NAD(P)-dependent oxidoreductase [Paenarthrobacter sp. OM7]|uniref:NAD-dependent epimerase/dehydratase family protein n=1 Tax=Paenarthrobacter sp. OM7 TaxID=3041264 RepID=UPI00246929A9|nr:NAD(P)-dependent oxidoreductase [Paenarthrobacter sp. OM7]WGM21152.1 NAD(P)-dependent oxidoreductase [Paenarthrobacter sp. OM7]